MNNGTPGQSRYLIKYQTIIFSTQIIPFCDRFGTVADREFRGPRFDSGVRLLLTETWFSVVRGGGGDTDMVPLIG